MPATAEHPAPTTQPDDLRLIRWSNDDDLTFGHDPRSTYVEHFWLGTLGPTTTWFLRHCAHLLEGKDSTTMNLRDVAKALGIGYRGGNRSALSRTVARACRFRAARPVGSNTLAVRLKLPHLSLSQQRRLPKHLRRLHDLYVAPGLGTDPFSHEQARARQLALSMIKCGDTPEDAEIYLACMKLHPAIVAEAVRWAKQRRRNCNNGAPQRAAVSVTSFTPDAA